MFTIILQLILGYLLCQFVACFFHDPFILYVYYAGLIFIAITVIVSFIEIVIAFFKDGD